MANTRPLVLPGILLGVGLGGFVDGIVLHQMLQWHHMLTSHGDYPATTVAGLEVNTLWDGIFHSGTWIAVVVGLALLFRAGVQTPRLRWSLQTFIGSLAVGWGLFNLVEGVVDHHLLGIHHVRDDLGAPLAWDLGFLAFGALLVVGGWLLLRSDREPAGDVAASGAAERSTPAREPAAEDAGEPPEERAGRRRGSRRRRRQR